MKLFGNLCANVRSFIAGIHRILTDDLRVNRYTVGRPIFPISTSCMGGMKSSHILMMTMNGNSLAGLASGRFRRRWRCVSTVRIGETNCKEYPVVLNPKQTSWSERQDKGAPRFDKWENLWQQIKQISGWSTRWPSVCNAWHIQRG
jgi:hypothetical protein